MAFLKKKIIISLTVFISIIILLGVSFFLFFTLSQVDVTRVPFPLKTNSAKTWEDVFNNPKSIIVETYTTGKLDVQYSGLINLKHKKAAQIKDRNLQIPVFAWLVRHKKFGDYLVDTGLDASYHTKPYGSMKGLLVPMFLGKATQEKGNDIASVLRNRNINLKGVFLTHLHFDHMAGIIDLPRNIQYVIGKGEILQNRTYLFYGDHFKNIDKVYEIDFTNTPKMSPLSHSVDIFGDGSLWAISAPGHTNAFTAYLVNSKDGPVLILSDSCSMKISLEKGIGPGTFSSDIEHGQKMLDAFIAFKRQFPKLKIKLGHEEY